jgi:hypothetical protein
MHIDSLLSLPASASRVPRAVAGMKPDFKRVLQKYVPPTENEKKARKKAEDAAADLVSNALIMPILTQVRRSPFNADGPFSPGKEEKAFGPQFDMQLADRIARSPKLGIKNALADRLMKRGLARAQGGLKGLNVHG